MSKTRFLGFLATIMASLLLVISLSYLGKSTKALASTSFGSCPNPGGGVVASYANGLHWIVGNGQLQQGSDAVYSHGDNTYTQCFCPLTNNNQPTGGLGTQTNWIFTGSINSTTKQSLLNNGWVSVADGSIFGLSSGEYITKNSSFSCGNNQVSTSLHISQNNNTHIVNNVSTSINTGGNKTNLNNSSVTTGNASSNTTITNNSGSNTLHVSQQQNSQMHTKMSSNGSYSSSNVHVGH